MKKIILLFVMMIFSSALISFAHKSTVTTSPITKTSEPEDLVKQLVKILNKKDYEGLQKIILTQKEGLDLVNASELDSKEKERGFIAIIKQVKEMESESKQNLEDVIKKFEERGVIVKELTYKTCEYKLEKTKGIFALDLFIDVSFRDQAFRLRSKGNLKANSNWCFTGHLVITPTKNEAKQEAREKAIMDSIATAISESLQNGDK